MNSLTITLLAILAITSAKPSGWKNWNNQDVVTAGDHNDLVLPESLHAGDASVNGPSNSLREIIGPHGGDASVVGGNGGESSIVGSYIGDASLIGPSSGHVTIVGPTSENANIIGSSAADKPVHKEISWVGYNGHTSGSKVDAKNSHIIKVMILKSKEHGHNSNTVGIPTIEYASFKKLSDDYTSNEESVKHTTVKHYNIASYTNIRDGDNNKHPNGVLAGPHALSATIAGPSGTIIVDGMCEA